MRQLLIILAGLVLFSCQQKGKEKTLYIAVASNAQFAVGEIVRAFEDSCRCPVEMIVGSSGKLTAQIEQGAPYHVMLSANMKYPEYLANKGLTVSGPEVYAKGSLVVWTVHDTELNSMGQLTDPEFKSVAIANPLNAPYGEAAVIALRNAGLYNQVEGKLVYGESIAQTTQFIFTGSADAGITAGSVLRSPQFEGQGASMAVPDTLYPPIKQGMVIVNAGEGAIREKAQSFRRFLLSPKSREVLGKWGYH